MHISEEAKAVLRKIAQIQVKSYYRILEKGITPEDVHIFRLEPQDIEQYAHRIIGEYHSLCGRPQNISIFDDREIATMRHILYRMEDTWVNTYPQGCRDLWEVFFQIEECRNPIISFSLKDLQNDKERRRSEQG
ncbi:MAG: hypothetical protein RSC49_08230 [Clostridium sp.]